MKPDNFEDISAVLALYRPGPMGVNSHTNYALRRRPAADHADPPRARGAAPRGARAHLRADRVPGAGAEGGADPGRVHARPRPPAARAMRQEKRRSWTRSSSVPAGLPGGVATPTRPSRRYVDAAGARFRYASTSAHRGVRADRVLDRVPKGNYPAEYMAALLTSVGDDKDKSALYLSEVAGWASRCCA